MMDILSQLLQPVLDELAAFWQVIIGLLTAAGGLVLLLSGRRIYWFFIAAVGFFLGVYLGFRFVTAGGWLHWLLILGMGVLFAALARLANKVMAIIAVALVFAAVGYLLPPPGWLVAVRIVAACILGFIGMYLAMRLFDWALIFGSAALGAWLVYNVLPIVARLAGQTAPKGGTLLLVLGGLVILGVVVQAFGLPKKRLL